MIECNINNEEDFYNRVLNNLVPTEKLIFRAAKSNFHKDFNNDPDTLLSTLHNPSKLEKIFDELGIKYNEPIGVFDTQVCNIQSQWSDKPINILFRGMNVGANYFDHFFNQKILSAVLLGEDGASRYPSTNRQLNQGMEDVKNDIFHDLYNYAVNNGIIDKSDTLDKDGNELDLIVGKETMDDGYALYKDMMPKIENYLLNKMSSNQVDTQTNIPKFKNASLRYPGEDFKAYCNAITLLNFDTFVKDKMSGILGVNVDGFNSFSTSNAGDKYVKQISGVVTEYFKDDSYQDQDVEGIVDTLSKKISSIIPLYNMEGKPMGNYLTINDITSFGASVFRYEKDNMKSILNNEKWIHLLAPNLFKDDPVGMLRWYCDYAIEEYKNEHWNSPFKQNVGIAYSLNYFLDGLDTKEKNSDNAVGRLLAHTIQNSFEATYDSDFSDGKQQSISGSSNNYDRIDLQKSVYSYLKSVMTTPEVLTVTSTEEKTTVASVIGDIKRLTGVKLNNKCAESVIKKTQTKGGINSVVISLNDIKDFIVGTGFYHKESALLTKIEELEENKITQSKITKVINSLVSSPFMQDVFDAKMSTIIQHPATYIFDENGNKVPTVVTSHFGSNDTAVLAMEQRHEALVKELIKDTKYTNFYTKYGGLDTDIRLQASNNNGKKERTKDAADLNAYENFFSHFKFGFYDQLFHYDGDRRHQYGKFHFQVGDYSDKVRTLDKTFDMSTKFKHKINGVDKEYNFETVTPEVLRSMLKESYTNYYTDLANTVIAKYKSLGEQYGLRFTNNVTDNISKINLFLSKYSHDELLEIFHNSKQDFTEELDYSAYNKNKGGLRFNKDIENYVRMANGDSRYDFDNFIKTNEDIAIQKLYKLSGKDYIGLDTVDDAEDSRIPFYIDGKINPIFEKWYLAYEFFNNEYLYAATKPEYMHPVKKFGEDNMQGWLSEQSDRLVKMAKRNVAYTGSTEYPDMSRKDGVPDKLNIAVIKDLSAPMYNIAGDTAKQDVHDGSSVISSVYSMMLDASYCGKYEGTKKRLGTLVTPFSSALKKDAETLLTNAKILDSKDSEMNMLSMMRKMFDIPCDFQPSQQKYLTKDNTYIKNGRIQAIQYYEIKKEGKQAYLVTGKNVWDGNGWQSTGESKDKINNLFDVWNLFGAQYSVDRTGNDWKFSEGSQRLLYNFVCDNNLKDKMIHVVSNVSAFKSGASNLHPSYYWTKDVDDKTKKPLHLKYTSYEHKNIGVQLSTVHEAAGLKIKEVTQMISSIAQNPDTAWRANDVYNELAESIRRQAKKYLPEDPKSAYVALSKRMVHNLAKSNDDISRTIGATVKGDLPFSNPNIFHEFIKNLISDMNDNFITRYYNGMGGTLNPSHRIIQLYEDNQGNEYSQSDLAELALNDHIGKWNWGDPVDAAGSHYLISNDDIVNNYIKNNPLFKPIQVNSDEIRIGDTCEVDGKQYHIDNLEDYYNFKDKFQNVPINKVFTHVRDLKPIEISWNVKRGDTIEGNMNLFDLPSVKLMYDGVYGPGKYTAELENFKQHFGITDNKALKIKLNNFTQRYLSMLSKGKMLDIKMEDLKGDLNDVFGKDDLSSANIINELPFYQTKAIDIVGYKKRAAECMINDIYDNGDSVAKIRMQGPQYFRNKLDNLYNTEVPDGLNASYRLRGRRDVFVVFGESVPGDNYEISYDGDKEVHKRVMDGKELYAIPDGTSYKDMGGYDVLYIPNGENATSKSDEFIKSYGSFKAIVPLQYTTEVIHVIKNFLGYTGALETIEDIEAIKIDLANKMYASWEKSREFVVSHIPALSLQSVMEMKNVAYNRGKSNDVYVSVWQIFIQGSDFDIDKAYFMGYGLNNAGLFELGNDVFNYHSKADIDLIEKINLPDGKTRTLDPNGTLFTTEFGKFKECNTDDSKRLQSEGIKAIGETINKLRNEDKIGIGHIAEKDQPLAKAFISIINKYNTGKNYMDSKWGLSNNIIAKVKTIISSATNQIYANRPVNTENIEEICSQQKKMKLNTILEIPMDYGFGYVRTIESCEKVYGLYNLRNVIEEKEPPQIIEAAKRIFTLVNTNIPHDVISMYKQQEDAIACKNTIGIEINGIKFMLTVSNYYNSQIHAMENIDPCDIPFMSGSFKKEIYIKDKKFTKCTITDVTTPLWLKNKITEAYNIKPIDNFNIAIGGMAIQYMSEFASATIDNTKSSIITNINAIPELANIPIYMIALGFTPQEVAEYMNSPVVDYIVAHKDNIYTEEYKPYVSTILEDYEGDDKEQFLDMFEGGEEISTMAQILGVNQRMKADTGNMFRFLIKLNKAMRTREWEVYNRGKSFTTKVPHDIDGVKKHMKDIIRNMGIKDTIENRNKISAKLVGFFGIDTEDGKKDIVGDFSYKYWLNNPTYRKRAIEYYQMIKSTVNIFDVLDKSSMFNEMVNGIGFMHNIAMRNSAKYKFIMSTLESQSLNNKYDSQCNETAIKKLSTLFDGYVIKNWLANTNKIIKVNDWLKSAGINGIIMYTSDLAKQYPGESDYSIHVSPLSDPFYIDFKNDYDLANFKVLMERAILQAISDTDFMEMIVLNAVKNPMGLYGTQITNLNDLTRLNNESGFIRCQQVYDAFNSLDNDDDINVENRMLDKDRNAIFTYDDGDILKIKDMFWLYNLITNDESFGLKRLSSLFNDYLQNKNILPYNYYKYYATIDRGEKNPLPEDIEEISEYIINKKKYIRIFSIKNSDFIVNTSYYL